MALAVPEDPVVRDSEVKEKGSLTADAHKKVLKQKRIVVLITTVRFLTIIHLILLMSRSKPIL